MVLWLGTANSGDFLYCFSSASSYVRHAPSNTKMRPPSELMLLGWLVTLPGDSGGFFAGSLVGSAVVTHESVTGLDRDRPRKFSRKLVMEESRHNRQMMTTDQIQQFPHHPSTLASSDSHPWPGGHLMSSLIWVLCWAFHDHVDIASRTLSMNFDCMTTRVVRRGWTKRMLHISTWFSIPPYLVRLSCCSNPF